jgi:hypothetical protein
MNIGEMALLWNDNNEQVLPISEGFVETRIIYTMQENNLTTGRTHDL